MRKNSLGKRIAALTAAVILTTAMTVPAFAADPTAPTVPADPAISEGLTTIGFQKKVDAADDTYQPDLTFTFAVSDGAAGTYKHGDVSDTVYAGKANDGIQISDVKTDTSILGGHTYTSGVITFTSDPTKTYEQPGIYNYKVQEKAGTNTHTVYDVTTKDLYVYVKRNDSNALVIYGAALVDADGMKTDLFTNVYKYNDNKNNEFKNLTVTKAVTGNQGDKTKEFTFKVKITSSADGRKLYNAVKPDKTVATLTVGQDYTFTLKDGDTFIVDKLADGDKYTVSEEVAANYAATATLKNSDSPATSYTLTTETTMTDHQNDVVITNERDAATPTGIVMNIAPYVLMLLGALCAAFVFFRKKKVEE